MTKAKILFLSFLSVAALIPFMCSLLQKSTENPPLDAEQQFSRLLERTETDPDHLLVFKGQRPVLWRAGNIPEFIDSDIQSGIYEGSTGTYLCIVKRKADSTSVGYTPLSRVFEYQNPYVNTIASQSPFSKVSLEQKADFIPLQFKQQTFWVKPHLQEATTMQYLALCGFLLVLVLVCICFLPHLPPIASVCCAFLPFIFLQTLASIFPLEPFGFLFSPAFFASIGPFSSIAQLLAFLISLALGAFAVRPSSQFYLKLGYYSVVAATMTHLFPHFIYDGNLYPSTTIPFMVDKQGGVFWITLLLFILPLVTLLNPLFRWHTSKKQSYGIAVLALALLVGLHTTGHIYFLHNAWPVIPVLLIPLRVPSNAKWAVAAVFVSLGLCFSTVHFYGKKLATEAEILADQIRTSNNSEVAFYLLKEEWDRTENQRRFIPPFSDLRSFLNEQVLTGYLEHYEAQILDSTTTQEGVKLQGDTLTIGWKSVRFALSEKSSYNEVGFPALLSDNSWQIFPPSGFSYARYENGQLTQKSRALQLPRTTQQIPTYLASLKEHQRVLQRKTDTSNTFVFYPKYTPQKLVVVWLCLVALLLTLHFFVIQIPNYATAGLKLRQRILLGLLGIAVLTGVLLSALGYANITRQFKDQNAGFALEKAQAISRNLRANEENIWSQNLLLVGELEQNLLRIARIYETDISFYQTNGTLAASSEPLLYEEGLKSKLLNQDILQHIVATGRSVQLEESIGGLEFLSRYHPYYTNSGELYGIIYVPLFDKQQLLEQELRGYATANINVLLAVLVAALVLGNILARNIGKPLKRIEQELLSEDEYEQILPLQYTGKDEIGSLVAAYNQKIARIKELLQEVAKRERESAWRHMAQQVAHEIKNPLTPLKLKSQWLQTKLDALPEAEAKEKTKDLIATILDQTELLRNIANEFSQYAALDKINPTTFSCTQEIKKLISLYHDLDSVQFTVDAADHATLTMDLGHFKRIFTNLFNNAIQAKKTDTPLTIAIQITVQQDTTEISVRDNGVGMDAQTVEKIFQPNFTTKSSGTGLGLAMVKSMLNSASANIHVNSTPQEGSTFYITFNH